MAILFGQEPGTRSSYADRIDYGIIWIEIDVVKGNLEPRRYFGVEDNITRRVIMKQILVVLASLAAVVALSAFGCTDGPAGPSIIEPIISEGEESGLELALDEGYDGVRNGVHLVMIWDPDKAEFVGTVKNVTDAVIRDVRVEVHLSNGIELGPTPRADLAPGEVRDVRLAATPGFTGWIPHAESGAGGAGGEGSEGENGEGEGEGEHSEEGESGSG